jgi:hypothetical protein
LHNLFGLSDIFNMPIPHFSYHVSPTYNEALLNKKLLNLAAETEPFIIKSAGLGIFTTETPTVYINLVRSYALTELHQKIWLALRETSTDPVPYYHPNFWTPHITLNGADLHHDTIGDVIRFLSALDFTWDIEVNNLALLSHSDHTFKPPTDPTDRHLQETYVIRRFDFKG